MQAATNDLADPRTRWPLRLRRSSRDRVVVGIAGGIAERIGVDPTVIRLSFVALSLAAGIGVLLYLMLLPISFEPKDNGPEPAQASARQALAVGLMVVGVLVLLRSAGLWFGDGLVWPTVLIAVGSAVIWTRGEAADRGSSTSPTWSAPRLLAGVALVLAGFVLFLVLSGPLELLGEAPVAVLATVVAGGVVAGPWGWRLARQLTDERRRRIRSQERAQVAAHLHDSVLQTLAMIQRSSEPRSMASLARTQERELRSWLYGGHKAADPTLLSTAVNDSAAEIERIHRIAIDVVTVGDCTIDEPVSALVLAIREAMLNAAAHSGAPSVSVFVEVDDTGVSAYVRDQGRGFDPASVAPDRRGIVDSIRSRIEGQGGSSDLVTAAGRGTEIRLRLPRRIR
jgi:signal transduction histidine kinase